MKPTNRRKFMKSMLAVPFIASGISPLISSADSISEKFGHKLKISLNVYSFNKLLNDKLIAMGLAEQIGFLMQVEVEAVSRIIHNAKKPVMTIKSMAAGRVSPYVGITFSFSTIRPCDMVAIGAFTPAEVHEDVEIALAAIEHRYPNMETRNSPNKTNVLGGK